jgi:hypothetical protein
MAKTPIDYKAAAKKLRAFGLGGNFDLRSLTPQQKGAISRQYDKFRSIVEYPEQFQIVTVKNKTAKEITIAAKKVKKKNGKTKLIIPVEKGQKVTIKNGHAVFSGGGFNEEVYKGGWDFFDNAKKVFSKKLKKGEYVTVRIGDNRPFSTTFTDLNSLLHYMQAWTPTDTQKEKLISHISITRLDRKFALPPKRKSKSKATKKGK